MQGINVEPIPHHFEKLVRNRPLCINVNCALSSESGTKRFRHVVHPELGDNFGNGSLSHSAGHEEALIRDGCRFEEVEVPTMTYDELIQFSGFPHIDIFSLDVEGHETEVLKGMKDARFLPRLLCIETGHDMHGSIEENVQQMGYRKDSEYQVNSFYL